MNSYEEYKQRIENVVKVLINSTDVISDIFNSLDVDEDFNIIWLQISSLRLNVKEELLEGLIKRGKFNLIENNLRQIGYRIVSSVFKDHIDDDDEKYNQFREIVYNKFEDLIDGIIEFKVIESIIVEGRQDTRISKCMAELIKNLGPFDKNDVIDFLQKYSELYNVEEYLEQLLQIQNYGTINQYSDYSNIVLKKLRSIDSIDKIKLLKAVKENIEAIITNYKHNIYDEIAFLEELKLLLEQVPQEEQEVQEYINAIKNIISKNAITNLRQFNFNIDLMEILRTFGIDKIQFVENQDEIIANLSKGDLLRYIQQSKEQEGFYKQWDSKQLVSNIFKNDQSIITDDITLTMLSTLISELCKQTDTELCKQADIKPTDITLAGEGAYSLALEIGEYILKIGDERAYDRIVKDKRIIIPLVRQQTNPISEGEERKIQNDVPNLFIEVQPIVEANWYEGLSEDEIKEELYKVYADLRDRNIFWTDVKEENVGRLIKPNNGQFKINGQELKPDNEAIQSDGDEIKEILGPGELVVIDTDYIFLGNPTKEYVGAKMSYHREFEERYKREKEIYQNTILEEIANIAEHSGYTREEYERAKNEVMEVCDEVMIQEGAEGEGIQQYDN